MEKSAAASRPDIAATPPGGGETVILIHGLWMRGEIFLLQRRRLARRGFAVESFSYPSWSAGLAENVERLAHFVAALPAARIHLVGHSLGGLLALALLAGEADGRIARLVLMGSPYANCHCGNFLATHPLFSPALGRSLADWLRQPRPSLPAAVEIGIIAGTRRLGMGCFIPGLPQPNDGVVALSETCLPGARDSIALPVSHSGMLVSAACCEQIASFLESGAFIHA